MVTGNIKTMQLYLIRISLLSGVLANKNKNNKYLINLNYDMICNNI